MSPNQADLMLIQAMTWVQTKPRLEFKLSQDLSLKQAKIWIQNQAKI